MMPPQPLTGVVLAGGRSSRMGEDKALLRVGGRRLVDLAVGVLTAVCTEVIVAAGDRKLPDLAVPQISDSGADGPVGGILAALEHARTQLLAVVAVDMPFADAALLADLVRRWTGQVAVVPRASGRLQPLHAVYATHSAADIAAALHAGERSLTRLVLNLGGLIVEVDDDRFAYNVNAPGDLLAPQAPPPTRWS